MLPRERLVDIVVVLCEYARNCATVGVGAKKDTAALQQLVREQPACPLLDGMLCRVSANADWNLLEAYLGSVEFPKKITKFFRFHVISNL
jgi:hypothetical protein